MMTVLISQATNSKGIYRVAKCKSQSKAGVIAQVFMLIVLMLTSVALYAEETRYQFNIPAGEAGITLNLLAQQSNTPLLFPYDKVRHITTNAVMGNFTVDEAISFLLMNTGLQSEVDKRGVLVVTDGASNTNNKRGKDPVTVNNRKTWFSKILTILASAAAVTSVGAQSVNSTDSNAARSPSVLEEVTVTAQKRSEDIQEVPISITTLSGESIEASGIDTILDIQHYLPNFTINQGAQLTNTIVSVRGVGSVGNNAIEGSVGVYIDGIYYAKPGAALGNLLDIQNVELLRGPQGTLFGRNTPMGALNITTRDPSQEFEGMIKGSYGNYDAYTVSGMLSGGISERVAGRVAFKYSDRDGYGRSSFNNTGRFGERDDLSLRAKLLVDVNDDISAKLTVDYSKINPGAQTAEIDAATTPTFPNFAAFLGRNVQFFGLAPDISDSTDYFVNTPVGNETDDEQWGLSLDVSWQLPGEHTLRSISAYRNWEHNTEQLVQGYPAEFLTRGGLFKTESVSQEFQLLSEKGQKLEYVLGLYYYNEDYTLNEYFDLEPQMCTGLIAGIAPPRVGLCAANAQDDAALAFFKQDIESFAVFGQATFNVTDRIALTGGLRYTDDSKDATFEGILNNPILGAVGLRAASPMIDLNKNESEVTWMTNVRFFLHEDYMLYGSVSTGFKSGGFNGQGAGSLLSAQERTFDAESTTNYEAGLKSTLLDGKVNANITIFRTDVEDLQDRVFDGVGGFLVRNAAELRQQGVEIDIRARLLPQLLTTLGVGYLDSEFLSYPGAVGLPGNPPQDLSGQRAHRTPEWTLSSSARWDDALPNTELDWYLLAEYNYTSEQNLGSTTNGNPQTIQDGYGLVNFRAGIAAQEQSWEVSAFVKNIGDETYCLQYFDQPLAGPFRGIDAATSTNVVSCVLGLPRTYGVELSYRF